MTKKQLNVIKHKLQDCKYRDKSLFGKYCNNPKRREEEGDIVLMRCIRNCRWLDD